MADYGIRTDQLSLYRESVHGQALFERHDLGAPVCNDCHGNHGAAPPGVASLGAVCGTCHAMEAQLFAVSPHAEAFAENEFPICEVCHSNHGILRPSDSMIGSSEDALCTECHDADDGTIGLATADSSRAMIEKLVLAHQQAQAVFSEAHDKGMMTTDEEFMLNEVAQVLIQTRTLIHAFNADSVATRAVTGIALADSVRAASIDLIDEYYYRRWGLGLATLFMTLLAILLYRKIRHLDE
jgi:predicted CXXCH cytochrome family protein